MAMPSSAGIPISNQDRFLWRPKKLQPPEQVRTKSRASESPPPSPTDPSGEPAAKAGRESKALQIGSPVVVVEAPLTLKTATAVPCLRLNEGLVKPGDVGRIVARKPKDVWAVRLAIGTYLIDGKHFEPFDLEEETS